MFSVAALLLVMTAGVGAQSVEVSGAAGVTVMNDGRSAAATIGFAPWRRLTLAVGVDHTALPTRVTRDARGHTSAFRGGTLTLGTLGVQVSLLGRERPSPYVLAGYGLGRTTPNVNEIFPTPVTHTARVLFAGAGMQVPLGRLVLFGDARMIVGAEGHDGIVALTPIRAGVSWRFD